ncbi:hypothetical protein FAI40_02815 [Acetobacteraceae bacterium]|nr:hypothetical protein FAI40_02815 [Acetobacteraceae bacterium]
MLPFKTTAQEANVLDKNLEQPASSTPIENSSSKKSSLKSHFKGISPEEEAEAMAYDSNNPKEWGKNAPYGFQNEKGNIVDLDNNAMGRLYPPAPADPPPKDDMDYSHLFCPSLGRYARWTKKIDKGHDANGNLLIIHQLDCPEFRHLPFLDHDGAGISGEMAYRRNCEKFSRKVGKMTFEEQQKNHIFDHIPQGCGG